MGRSDKRSRTWRNTPAKDLLRKYAKRSSRPDDESAPRPPTWEGAPKRAHDGEQFLETWLEDTVKPSRRDNTYKGYESNVRLHIVPAIGNLARAHLKPAHVRKMLADQLRSGLSPRSVQYVRAVLRVALKQAQTDGIIQSNVAELAPSPSVRRSEIRPLTPAQVKAFLAGVSEDRLRGLYTLAFTTGLRQSEILGLRWEDVDFGAGSLRVVQTLSRGPGINFGLPKSEKSRRTLLPATLTMTALGQHRDRQAEERAAAGKEWREHDLIFTTHFGTPIDHRNLCRYFSSHIARLGLPHQRFHDARHSCATYLLSQGVPLRVVQEILGHSQLSITADLYAHVVPALQREAMGLIDLAFSPLEEAVSSPVVVSVVVNSDELPRGAAVGVKTRFK